MKALKILLITSTLFYTSSFYAQEETADIEENLEKPTIEKLSPAEKKFAKLDFNGDGSVDFKEYQNANMNVKRKSKNYSVIALKLSKRFSAIDGNRNNKIELSELEISMIPEKERSYLSKKHQVFSKIDLNHDDEIDFKEFSRISAMGKIIRYRKGGTEKEKGKKFAWFDTDKDSIISFEEFKIDKNIVKKK